MYMYIWCKAVNEYSYWFVAKCKLQVSHLNFYLRGDKFAELPSNLLQALPKEAIVKFDYNIIRNIGKSDLEMIISKQFKMDLQGISA